MKKRIIQYACTINIGSFSLCYNREEDTRNSDISEYDNKYLRDQRVADQETIGQNLSETEM